MSHSDEIPMVGSLVEVMRWRAQQHPHRALYQRLVDLECVETVTYGDADLRARWLAIELQKRLPQNSRILLLYPHGLEYTVVFLACLYAGMTAVPALPPEPGRLRQSLPRIRTLAKDANPQLILTTNELLSAVELARDETPKPQQVECLATDQLPTLESESAKWQMPVDLPDRLAFLQYTSGSTGSPKGVKISHRNLAEHQRLAHGVFQRPEESITVSWLPFYHDMGLIGSLLYPLFSGGTALLMSPTSFLRRPMGWLHAISRYRANVSTGPNFAYDLCVQRATPQDLEELDLSCWELTVCGAEPLRANTLKRFVQRFGVCGFREETFLPCYGLAEATLMASGSRVDEKPKITCFDRKALRKNRANEVDCETPSGSSAEAISFVSCGKAMVQHSLSILDLDNGREVGPGRVGEICLRGPSVGGGYWDNPDRTEQAFELADSDTSSDGSGNFFRTGDTGFTHDGELYVTGRRADLLRVGDEIYQPHEIEDSIMGLASPIVSGSCVAFVCPERSDHTFVATEIRRNRSSEELSDLARGIQQAVRDLHQLEVRVLLIPPRSIAKTSSGKLRRFAYRDAYLSEKLEILYDSALDNSTNTDDALRLTASQRVGR